MCVCVCVCVCVCACACFTELVFCSLVGCLLASTENVWVCVDIRRFEPHYIVSVTHRLKISVCNTELPSYFVLWEYIVVLNKMAVVMWLLPFAEGAAELAMC